MQIDRTVWHLRLEDPYSYGLEKVGQDYNRT